MLKKLTAIGSSRGLLLDKTLLGLLGLDGVDHVSIRLKGRRLIVEAPNAFDEIRARVPPDQKEAATDALIDRVAKRERQRTTEQLRRRRAR